MHPLRNPQLAISEDVVSEQTVLQFAIQSASTSFQVMKQFLRTVLQVSSQAATQAGQAVQIQEIAVVRQSNSKMYLIMLIYIIMEPRFTLKQLQIKVSEHNDEIGDLYTLINLNLAAIRVEVDKRFKPELVEQAKDTIQTIDRIQKDTNDTRLSLLITEQISFEEVNLRKERLEEYEQKIQEQRRLLHDKDTNLNNLTTVKKKRPPYMTPEQFENSKMQQRIKDNHAFFDEVLQNLEEYRLFNKLAQTQKGKLKHEHEQLKLYKTSMTKYMQKLKLSFKKEVNYHSFIHQDYVVIPQFDYNKTKVSTEIKYTTPHKYSQIEAVLDVLTNRYKENSKLLKKLQDEKQMTDYLSQQNKSLMTKYTNSETIQSVKEKEIKQVEFLLDQDIFQTHSSIF